MKLDDSDRKILNIINKAMPITREPFRAVAEQTGISEPEVIDRVNKLKEAGIIRRIGAVINPRNIGWKSTLCATEVSPERLNDFAAVVGRYDEITHNYIREGHPNCWFTIIAPDNERLTHIISEIEQTLDIKVLNLPAKKVFKIQVNFDIQ